MKKNLSKASRNYTLLIICLICILMISSSTAMLMTYSETIEEESGNVAKQYVESTANNLRSGIDAYKTQTLNLVRTILSTAYEDEKDFSVQLHRLSRDERFEDIMFVRYFKDGVEYDITGDVFEADMESVEVKKMIEKRVLTCVGVVSDRQYNVSTTAFCVPIDGFEYADAMVVCYPVAKVVGYSKALSDTDYTSSRFTVICSTQGEVVRLLYADEEAVVQEHSDIYDFLRGELNNKQMLDELRITINSGASGNYSETVSGQPCILSVSGIREYDNTSFSVVGYYRAADIYKSGYFIIRSLLGEFLVFFVIVLAVGVYGIIQRWKNKKLFATINDTNKVLGCDSRVKFERVAAEIIARNKATLFAVAVIDVTHYEYIREQIGNEKMIAILKHLKMLYSKIMQIDERYAYAENGRFVLLLHYRDINNLASRLNSVVALATQHSSQLTSSFSLVLVGGIYTTERKITDNVQKMIDLAIEAENATKFPCDFGVFRIYNETLYASSVQNDYIEVHMESALQNHEYKVFYQAKYNIADDRIDGCEALVRWYNYKLDEYMQPDVFLPLFEANRFIVKLDHYVFEQVCIYITDSIKNGFPLYPVSVNASRITATEKDFVEFYAATKKKYNIADGFVTIEFTESFAYEDYGMLRNIVSELHKNGFKCSIDDFGSGFSSYNILKELPMDEIKLDRFFIKSGYSKERDLKILSSVISLARDLHMKVTQEGVENEDDIDLLKKLGCQVIQGYYYSRPLALTDYIGFITNNKRI